MNPLVATLTVAGLTTFAKWSKGEQLGIENIVGFFVIGAILAFLDTANKDFARVFSWLVVLGTALAHAEAIGKAVTGE